MTHWQRRKKTKPIKVISLLIRLRSEVSIQTICKEKNEAIKVIFFLTLQVKSYI